MSTVAGAGSGTGDDVAGMRDDLGRTVGAAGAKVRDLRDDVRQLTGDASDLKGMASDFAGSAAEHGRHLLDAARSHATTFADQRKNEAAQSIADIASSLRDSGDTFEDRPNIRAFIGGAAEGLDQLAGSIRDRSFAELYAEAEAYARQKPVTVALVTAAAGFMLARFVKSSAADLSQANAAAARTPAARRPATA